MCIHAGTHLTALMAKLGKKKQTIKVPVYLLLAGISVYGCAASIKRGFPGYMTGSTMFAFFDYSEPLVFFILDYLAVIVLFMMLGWIAVRLLDAADRNFKKKRRNQK
jgi:hypothetical protein